MADTTEIDYASYLDKPATVLQQRMVDWLQSDEVGADPNTFKSKSAAFAEGVRLGIALRIPFQASDFNRAETAKQRAASEKARQEAADRAAAAPKAEKAAAPAKATKATKAAKAAPAATEEDADEAPAPATTKRAPARRAPARRAPAAASKGGDAPF